MDKLSPQNQLAIERLRSRFGLTHSFEQELITVANELEMATNLCIDELFSDAKNRSKFFDDFRKNKQRLYATKSYDGFNAHRSNSCAKIVSKKNDHLGLGRCPVASEQTLCCNLLTLDAIESCVFGCSYCAINSFYTKGVIGVDEDFSQKLSKLQFDHSQIYHIGTGQSSDSLALGNRGGNLEAVLELGRKNPNVIVELKSKSNNIEHLLSSDIAPNIISSWSLNPDIIIKNEEHGCASLEQRLGCAKKIAAKNRLVGFHFHPMIYYDSYQKDYAKIVSSLLDSFSPDLVAMVSIGTLTFTKASLKQIRHARGRTKILQMPLVEVNKKYSYPHDIKKQMFSFLYELFGPWHDKVFFYFCMEDGKFSSDILGKSYKTNEDFEQDMKHSYMQKIRSII